MKISIAMLLALYFLSVPYTGYAKPIMARAINRVELSIYNQGFGLVYEERPVEVQQGKLKLIIPSVSSRIIPDSITVRAHGIEVIGTCHEYDLADPSLLLKHYLGRQIMYKENPISKDKEPVPAKLLSFFDGKPVFLIQKDKIFFGEPSKVIFPDDPQLVKSPSILMDARSKVAQKTLLKVMYMTKGLDWHADYALVLDGRYARLKGWVNIDNSSGKDFKRVSVRLVAGKVKREREKREKGLLLMAQSSVGRGEEHFKESKLFEYHIYDLEGSLDIQDGKVLRVEFLDIPSVGFKKRYVSSSHIYNYRIPRPVPQTQNVGVQIYMEKGINRPLPAGLMRVYQQDEKGMIFLGESRLRNIPEKEEISINVGKAFDLLVEGNRRRLRGFLKISLSMNMRSWS